MSCPGYVLSGLCLSGLCLCPGYVCVQVISMSGLCLCPGCVCPGYALCQYKIVDAPWHFEQLSQNIFFYPNSPSMKKIDNKDLFKQAKKRNRTEIVAINVVASRGRTTNTRFI